jgi:hypothetical protein
MAEAMHRLDEILWQVNLHAESYKLMLRIEWNMRINK